VYTTRWKWPKVLYALFIIELAGSVAALALFGIASPDLYRTILWRIGYNEMFNSDPNQILYAYANYRPIPTTPFVWSQTLTDFNVAVSVLSVFVLLVKVIMFVLHVWWPILGTISNGAITVLWIVSMYGQMGPDHSDPRYPSNIAWYISKSCDIAKPYGAYGYCRQAKSAYAVTVIMMVIFLSNMLLGIWSMIPTAEERAANKMEIDDMQTKHSPMSDNSERSWEMKKYPGVQATPAQPYTPRTLAFNTLDRQLPLRSQQESRWA